MEVIALKIQMIDAYFVNTKNIIIIVKSGIIRCVLMTLVNLIVHLLRIKHVRGSQSLDIVVLITNLGVSQVLKAVIVPPAQSAKEV